MSCHLRVKDLIEWESEMSEDMASIAFSMLVLDSSLVSSPILTFFFFFLLLVFKWF